MERENKAEGTREFTRLEVFEKAATKKDNHNRPDFYYNIYYNVEITGLKISR